MQDVLYKPHVEIAVTDVGDLNTELFMLVGKLLAFINILLFQKFIYTNVT